MTEGPFWVDENLNRADITTDTTRDSVINGYPLDLNLYVYNNDGASCGALPVSNVQIDIWHCDAVGDYSDVSGNGQANTIGQDFLRGYQVTDASGKASFRTIYPGWYSGRAIHIHLRARVYDQIGNTTYNFTSQLFFDDSVSDSVLIMSPYNTRGSRNTFNSNDNIYRGAQSPLDLLLTAGDGKITGDIAFGLSGLPDTVLNSSFAVTTLAAGSAAIPTLTSTLTVASADVASQGTIFVAAQAGEQLFFNNGGTWIPYTSDMGANYPAFYSGQLQQQHELQILSGVDVSSQGPINFYVGYGSDGNDMVQQGRYQLAHTL